ncbi:bifunctional hydroxymethylpyrimidine kinase/phosphomethylpyrimidine kinase [Congregicoccus parvus]|uniref:bifunctional hydroxymethylpyrimidine kinase/phosphomethylpyrimidine kinase n=1 Tax=Congregicoccus parvus TaxID=3081749 RepID=UPI003FA5A547
MNRPRLVVVHSLTAHGRVGLKPFLDVIGVDCLPVPSLVASGPGDMPGARRQTLDPADLLLATLEACSGLATPVDLFIGYLADATQAERLAKVVDKRRDRIRHLIVDPVCGDDGRAYVARELIERWSVLLARADWLLPNATEAMLLTGTQHAESIEALRVRYPHAGIVVTGLLTEDAVETHVQPPPPARAFVHRQPRISGRANGTGDLFAATWWHEFCQSSRSLEEAVDVAARAAATLVAVQPPASLVPSFP